MNHVVRPTLPRFERCLLTTVGRLVPVQDRDEWSRTWQAELWYMHQRSHHRHISPLAGITDLSIGLLRDALWLRTEDWRLSFSDTATAVSCLAAGSQSVVEPDRAGTGWELGLASPLPA